MSSQSAFQNAIAVNGPIGFLQPSCRTALLRFHSLSFDAPSGVLVVIKGKESPVLPFLFM